MPTKIYWIENFASKARLGIMARPRGNEWLDDEIASLKKQNVRLLVSLLEPDETYELGLSQEASVCSNHEIGFINFPITDRSIPKNESKASALIDLLSTRIDEGISVVVHCRMGIGRSSIIAGSILLKKGQRFDTVIHRITTIRGLSVPDTAEQLAWLKKKGH